jgi:hypothetical protein
MASSVELKEERDWSVGENGHQEKAPEGMQGFICQGELGLPAGHCRPGVMHVVSGVRCRARPCAKRREGVRVHAGTRMSVVASREESGACRAGTWRGLWRSWAAPTGWLSAEVVRGVGWRGVGRGLRLEASEQWSTLATSASERGLGEVSAGLSLRARARW